jgi:hypothetical protein
MVTDASIDYIYSPETPGIGVAFVIDREVLYTAPVWATFGQKLLDATEFRDVSSEYIEHNGMTIEILIDDQVVETWQTTEYAGSILLSNPLILDLSKYENGGYVEDLKASFDGTKFTIKTEG